MGPLDALLDDSADLPHRRENSNNHHFDSAAGAVERSDDSASIPSSLNNSRANAIPAGDSDRSTSQTSPVSKVSGGAPKSSVTNSPRASSTWTESGWTSETASPSRIMAFSAVSDVVLICRRKPRERGSSATSHRWMLPV